MHHIITWTALECQHELLCHFRAQPVTLSEIPGHSAYGPLNGGIHSNGMERQGTPRTMRSPNGRLPIQAHRRLGARVGQECAGGRGGRTMRYILSPRPPQRPLHKTIDISIKWRPKRSKQQTPPCASALPCVIPSEHVNEIKRKEGQMMSRMTLRSSPEIDNLSSPLWMMPLGTVYGFILRLIFCNRICKNFHKINPFFVFDE